ncbi:MAG: LysM peptidoglycan-binding domain-containing protein [Spirosomataceae bacterium]
MNWFVMNTNILKTTLLTGGLLGGMAICNVTFAKGWGGDSLGIENRVDKTVILHKVEEGESLYSLLKRYKSSLKMYSSENPETDGHIEIGQVIRIPMEEKYAKKVREQRAKQPAVAPADDEEVAKVPTKDEGTYTSPTKATDIKKADKVATKTSPTKPEATTSATTASVKHVVEAKQTMFSIAKKYGVSVADLERWNKLPNHNVKVGQVLLINPSATSVGSSTDKMVARTSNPKDTLRVKPMSKPEMAKNEPKKNDSTKIKDTKKVATAPNIPTKPADSSPAMILVSRQVKENGMAGLISVDDNSGKFLALHRTAPVGTLIQVRNESNNRSIFVKVIGKLPDTGLNDKMIIKISPSAYEKLSPVDRKFRAEITYTIQESVPANTVSASAKDLKGSK